MADPKSAILDQYDIDQTDDSGKVTGTYRVIVYRDGRVERWLRSPGQDPEKFGTRVQPTEKDRKDAERLVEQANKSDETARKGGSASADETVSAPPTQAAIVTRKPDGSITTTENPNYTPPKPEPTITRPLDKPKVIGPEGQETTTETVTKTQADYDRQAALDRQARAEAAAKQAYDNAMLAIAKDKLTAEQARDQYQKDLDKIRLDLQREQHADTMAATKRSQDITLRGQDLDAGVSQRNADLSASTQLAGEGSRIATALLPYWNAPGQIESTNSLMAGGPPVPTQPVSKPPISPNLPLELAAAAQAQMPSRFTMPGVPPAQPTPYAMPLG